MPPAPMTARPMRSEGAMRVAGGRWRDNVRRMGCAAIVDSWPVDPCPVDRLGADVSGAASLPESSVGNPAASAEPAATDLTKFRRLLAAGDLESDFPVSLMMHMRWRSVEGRVSRTGWPDNVSVGRSGQQKEERMRTTATLRKSRRRIIDAAARWARTAFVPLLLFGTVGCGANPSPADDLVRVVVETDMGAFELEVDIDRAPVTAANFLRYVDGGHYDGGVFHRTVHEDNQPNDSIRIAVIQGGRNRDAAVEGFPPIELERTSDTGITHVDGAVSMAQGRARYGHAQLLHLRRRPAVARLRGNAEPGRAGVRRLRQRGGGDGRGARDPPGSVRSPGFDAPGGDREGVPEGVRGGSRGGSRLRVFQPGGPGPLRGGSPSSKSRR